MEYLKLLVEKGLSHFISFHPFQSTQFNKRLLYIFIPLKSPFRMAKLEMTYSKQTQNSQDFLHVGICCHFFGWAPNAVGVHSEAKLNGKYIFCTGHTLTFTSLRECSQYQSHVRATRWNGRLGCSWHLLCTCHLFRAICRQRTWSGTGTARFELLLSLSIPFPFPISSPLSLSV